MQQLIQIIDEAVAWSPRDLTLLVVDYVITQQWLKPNVMSWSCFATLNSIFLPDSPFFFIDSDPDRKNHGSVRLSHVSGHPHLVFVTHHWYQQDQTYRYRFELFLMQEVFDANKVICGIVSKCMKRIDWHQPLQLPPFCHVYTDATMDHVVLACYLPSFFPTVKVTVIPFENPHKATTFDLGEKVRHVTIWQGFIYLLVGRPEILMKYSLDGQLKSQCDLVFCSSGKRVGIIEARGFQQWILMLEQSDVSGPMTKNWFPASEYRYVLLDVVTNRLFYSRITDGFHNSRLVGLDQDFIYTESCDNSSTYSTLQRFHWSVENGQFRWKPCLLSE